MLRVTGQAGQVIVGELIAVSGSGLSGDLLEGLAGEDLGAEYGGDAEVSDLEDEAGHFLGRRFAEIGWLDCADDLDIVGAGEIGPGVVVGEESAVVGRNSGYTLVDGVVEEVYSNGKGSEVVVVMVSVGRVEGDEGVVDKLGVTEGEVGVGPEVGVGVLAGFGEGEVEGPLVSGDGVVAEEEDEGVISLDAFGEVKSRLFEEKAIGDNDIGLGEDLGY